jgi:hypothetical protein
VVEKVIEKQVTLSEVQTIREIFEAPFPAQVLVCARRRVLPSNWNAFWKHAPSTHWLHYRRPPRHRTHPHPFTCTDVCVRPSVRRNA